MIAELLLVAVGLLLLTVAADQLVQGSSRLAERLRVSPVVVGVVVIGLGTSAPEFLVSGTAAARGDTGIAVGNIVGSNVLNLTLVLGLAALVARVEVGSSVIRREVPLALAAVAVFGVLARAGLNPLSATLSTVLLVGALGLLLRWATGSRSDPVATEVAAEAADRPTHRLPVEALRAALGLLGVLAGAQLVVANAAAVATHFGVPQFVIGFTLVALGTSLPELVTTVQSQRRGRSDLVVGNLFGSNLFNSLAGGAVIGFAEGTGPARAGVVALAAMVLTALLAWALLRRDHGLSRPEGAVLLAAYVLALPLLLAT